MISSIKEVAKLAGVSPATVSRVMNKTANVTEEKKQQVLKALKETGFRPNELARALYKKSSRLIGIITPDMGNPFFSEMARSIEGEAYKCGYRITMCNSDNNIDKEKEYMDVLSRLNADGIIIMTNHKALEEEMKKCDIPIVILDQYEVGGNEISLIHSDHYAGGRLAVEHLLECGCENIVQIRGPMGYHSGRMRFQAYADVCAERGLKPQYVDGGYDFASGIDQTYEILGRYKGVDGIIASNDMTAISVCKILQKEGFCIPEDVQVIGFDDIALGTMVTPEITTIAQSISEIGMLATKTLIDYQNETPIKKEQIIPVKLIQRATTKGKEEAK